MDARIRLYTDFEYYFEPNILDIGTILFIDKEFNEFYVDWKDKKVWVTIDEEGMIWFDIECHDFECTCNFVGPIEKLNAKHLSECSIESFEYNITSMDTPLYHIPIYFESIALYEEGRVYFVNEDVVERYNLYAEMIDY